MLSATSMTLSKHHSIVRSGHQLGSRCSLDLPNVVRKARSHRCLLTTLEVAAAWVLSLPTAPLSRALTRSSLAPRAIFRLLQSSGPGRKSAYGSRATRGGSSAAGVGLRICISNTASAESLYAEVLGQRTYLYADSRSAGVLLVREYSADILYYAERQLILTNVVLSISN